MTINHTTVTCCIHNQDGKIHPHKLYFSLFKFLTYCSFSGHIRFFYPLFTLLHSNSILFSCKEHIKPTFLLFLLHYLSIKTLYFSRQFISNLSSNIQLSQKLTSFCTFIQEVTCNTLIFSILENLNEMTNLIIELVLLIFLLLILVLILF